MSTTSALPPDKAGRPVGIELAAWADRLRAAGMRPKTVELRTGVVRAAYRDSGVRLVGELSPELAAAWIGRPGLSANTRRVYAVSWRQWARHVGLPADLVIPRAPRGLPRPALAAGVAAAQLGADPLVAAWIACGRWAGLRAAEVAGLRGEDVDASSGTLFILGKGGQLAAIPLDPRLAAVLAPYVSASGGGALWDAGPTAVSARAGAVLRAHGAADRFHQLRHFYGTAVYRGTGDLLRAQRALRHASPATTIVYAQLGDEALREAIALVP